mmetsp:Transcript_42278/g.111676  ORF Transcript_42278/g.111676 Transcript_42278/m.111676 type:complete len:283 (-) Transcript_42278:1310-2158(-)
MPTVGPAPVLEVVPGHEHGHVPALEPALAFAQSVLFERWRVDVECFHLVGRPSCSEVLPAHSVPEAVLLLSLQCLGHSVLLQVGTWSVKTARRRPILDQMVASWRATAGLASLLVAYPATSPEATKAFLVVALSPKVLPMPGHPRVPPPSQPAGLRLWGQSRWQHTTTNSSSRTLEYLGDRKRSSSLGHHSLQRLANCQSLPSKRSVPNCSLKYPCEALGSQRLDSWHTQILIQLVGVNQSSSCRWRRGRHNLEVADHFRRRTPQPQSQQMRRPKLPWKSPS